MSFEDWRARRQMKKTGIEVVDMPTPTEKPMHTVSSSKQSEPKQGILKRAVRGIDSSLTKLGDRAKAYKAKAPERQTARLERMKTKTTMMEAKTKMREVKMKSFEAKQKEMKARGIPDPFGGSSMMGGSMMGGVPTVKKGQPHIGKAKWKGKKKTKSKSKGKKSKPKSQGKSITINY